MSTIRELFRDAFLADDWLQRLLARLIIICGFATTAILILLVAAFLSGCYPDQYVNEAIAKAKCESRPGWVYASHMDPLAASAYARDSLKCYHVDSVRTIP